MRETLNSSEGRKMNLNENIQNLRNVLGICKSCIISSPLLTLKDEGRINGNGSLSGRLMALALGNKYKDLFSSGEMNPNDEEEFNERYMKVQKFLIELGKIFDEMVVPGSKWKNPIVDWFVKEMFRLNDSFYGLNRDIKEQTPSGISLNDWSYDDHDYIARFSFAEMYETIIRDLDALKESNKHLWIILYYPLLKLMDEEFKKLLGALEEKKIPTEEEFKEWSKNLFIVDFFNIKTYEDFCINYNYLKKKQKELFDMKQQVEKYFDENWDLKSDVNFGALHMENLGSFLRVPSIEKGINRTKHKIRKVFGKKNK